MEAGTAGYLIVGLLSCMGLSKLVVTKRAKDQKLNKKELARELKAEARGRAD